MLPGFTAGDLLVLAEDGSKVYLFSRTGRHLETRDALTGTVRFQFGYNGTGRLIAITDADSNVTTIERDSVGQPTAIEGPFGQRTTVTVDSTGFLASLTNPAGESVVLEHSVGGFLLSLTDPRGHTSQYTYDRGLLTRDADAAGGFVELERSREPGSFAVTMTTAEGRVTEYGVARRGKKVTKELAKRFGIDRRDLGKRVEQIKRASGLGGADNVVIDDVGNVFDKRSGELIGNVHDELPSK